MEEVESFLGEDDNQERRREFVGLFLEVEPIWKSEEEQIIEFQIEKDKLKLEIDTLKKEALQHKKEDRI